MFLSYSLYKLNNLSISLFDTKICKQHLQECLLKCLTCYEEMDNTGSGEYVMENRIIMESINLNLNIDDFGTFQRVIKLDQVIKSSFVLETSIKMSISFHQRNFYKFLHYMQELPHLVGAIAALNLSYVRKEVLRIFTIAYSSQSLKVPINFIQELLIYDDKMNLVRHLNELCIHENIDDVTISAVNFSRKKYDSTKFLVSIYYSH